MSGGEHDAMVLYERSLSEWRVALEAVQGCVTRTEFEEFRGHVDQRFDQIDQRFDQIANQMTLVVGELRGIRKDMAGHAQASELRALDQRVTALERRAGP
jgi:archaellum component FlaC